MKKLLAAAVLAAATPLAVAADGGVIVYGKVHVSVDSNDFETTDNYTVSSRSSRLGFKGSEDLGNGLKAIWQYEMTYSGLDGDGQFPVQRGIGSARNSYIGLAGDWGTVLVGRHDTPTKVAYYAAGVEELGDSILDLNEGANAPAQLFKEFRANNAIAYVSPSFAGVTVAAAVVPGESEVGGTDCRENCDGIADHWSVSAMYGGYGIKASIGYENKDLSYTGYDEKILQLGASYTLNGFKIGGMYQDVEDVGGSIGIDQSAWALVGSYSFGNNEIIAQYGERDLDGADDADTWGLGFNHNFSKRTSAYAAYATADEGSAGDTTQWSLGMIHSF
jgi:predicted porin